MTMSRSTATISVSLPPEMAVELDRVRTVEHRTRSELVHEALRRYIRAASVRGVRERAATIPEVKPTANEIEAIVEGRKQFRDRHFGAVGHALDRRAKRPRRKKP